MMTTLVDRSMCTRMDGDDDDSYIPCTCDELDDGAEEEESAVEEEAHVPPVLPQQPIQNLKPLLDHICSSNIDQITIKIQ